MGALPPRPTITPSRTTMAPTGASPRAPASRASTRAAAIHASSLAGAGIFDVEAVQDTVDHRREHDAGGPQQNNTAEERVKAVEELAGDGRVFLDRAHAGQEQRRLVEGIEPGELVDVVVADGPDQQRCADQRQR